MDRSMTSRRSPSPGQWPSPRQSTTLTSPLRGTRTQPEASTVAYTVGQNLSGTYPL